MMMLFILRLLASTNIEVSYLVSSAEWPAARLALPGPVMAMGDFQRKYRVSSESIEARYGAAKRVNAGSAAAKIARYFRS
jgi:hypothetical protein